jgi:hypothetical protein
MKNLQKLLLRVKYKSQTKMADLTLAGACTANLTKNYELQTDLGVMKPNQ